MEIINKLHDTTLFTYEISEQELTFLDTTPHTKEIGSRTYY